ncbi:MAG: YceI family protein [Phycisphaerales bacterium]
MHRSIVSLALAAGVISFGGAGVHLLGGGDATPQAQASTTRAGTFDVDAVHSSVVFKVGYMGVANFYGRFNEVEGTYSIDLENPSNSELDVTIPAESIDSNSEGRDRHLRGADFFSTKEFPTIRFVGNEFEAAGENTLRVTGDLTLRGVTQPVTVDLQWLGERPDPRGGVRSGFEAVFTIDRSDFGVSYGVDNGALGDATTVTVALTGMRQ